MGTGKLPCWEGKTDLFVQKQHTPTTKNFIVKSGLNAKETEMGTTALRLELRFQLYLFFFFFFFTANLLCNYARHLTILACLHQGVEWEAVWGILKVKS